MSVEIRINDGAPLVLKPIPLKPAERRKLKGSRVYGIINKQYSLVIEHSASVAFQTFHHVFRFFRRLRFSLFEPSGSIRLEAVLTGELPIDSPDGEDVVLKAGHYHLSAHPLVVSLFHRNSACNYFLTHYSLDLLKQLGLEHLVKPTKPARLTTRMAGLIQEVLNNPYEESLREFHHDNCIRELLLLHLSNTGDPIPGEFSEDYFAAIFAADSLMQQNLHKHYDIPSLAEQVGINELKLKQGFQKMFKSGVFARLTHHRMEYAKLLLSTSSRTIDDVADLSGFSGRNSFITAFKRSFGMTPHSWRVEEQGERAQNK